MSRIAFIGGFVKNKLKTSFLVLGLTLVSLTTDSHSAFADESPYIDRVGDCMLAALPEYFACKKAADGWWERAKCEAQDAASALACFGSVL